MRLYLAAPYAGRDIVTGVADVFRSAGHDLTSNWLKGTREIAPETLGASPGSSDTDVTIHAGGDLNDIDRSDAVVHFTASFLKGMDPTLDDVKHQLHSGGRHVETGWAIAMRKPVIVLGAPENIFQRGLCHVVPTIEECLDLLDEIEEDWGG